MGLILCMAGAVGALVSVLAIAVLSLMGKKAGVPLGLFALCAARSEERFSRNAETDG